ncbi:50S ribosomal protein L17 [Candidatus Saccharibacteria bacterium]|nr:50S ribosomal protein L17 [Candidatus Saccharibacteria bacterium]
MHRHGYKGRKFGRETDQRQALLRGLMCSLIQYQTITTTLAKAKELRSPTEKLITLAKKGDLASRRLVIARLGSLELGDLLVDVIAPQVKRDSGYLRIERAGFRKGDHAEMGTISFVDDIDLDLKKSSKKAPKAESTKTPAEKKPEEAKAPKAEKKGDK